MGFWMRQRLYFSSFQVHFPETGIIPPRNRTKLPLHPKTKLREQPLGWRVLVGESKWGNFWCAVEPKPSTGDLNSAAILQDHAILSVAHAQSAPQQSQTMMVSCWRFQCEVGVKGWRWWSYPVKKTERKSQPSDFFEKKIWENIHLQHLHFRYVSAMLLSTTAEFFSPQFGTSRPNLFVGGFQPLVCWGFQYLLFAHDSSSASTKPSHNSTCSISTLRWQSCKCVFTNMFQCRKIGLNICYHPKKQGELVYSPTFPIKRHLPCR